MKRGTHRNGEKKHFRIEMEKEKIKSQKNWLTSADTNVTNYLKICQVMDKNSVYIMGEFKACQRLARFTKLIAEKVQERQQNGKKD